MELPRALSGTKEGGLDAALIVKLCLKSRSLTFP